MPANRTDWDNLLFSKPAEAVDRIKSEAIQEARRIVHQDYLIATNRERWERSFYGAYPHLAAYKEVVEMKMVEVARQSPNTPLDQANHEIAKRSDAFVKHRKRFAQIDQEGAMWTGGPGFDGPQPPTPMDQGGTMGDTIKARRARRSGAFHNNRSLLGGN